MAGVKFLDSLFSNITYPGCAMRLYLPNCSITWTLDWSANGQTFIFIFSDPATTIDEKVNLVFEMYECKAFEIFETYPRKNSST